MNRPTDPGVVGRWPAVPLLRWAYYGDWSCRQHADRATTLTP
jgi:hypothetical protein